MKIRSITYFLDPGWPLQADRLAEALTFITSARAEFEAAGYDVQTVRLATVPFSKLLQKRGEAEAVAFAQGLEDALGGGFDYLSVGPALPGKPWSYAAIPAMIAATETVFASGLMTIGASGISLPAVQACGRIIQRLAPLSPDGFANLRFGALAGVAPGGPFLPGAYHGGGAPAFALATEAADLAVEAFSGAHTLAEGREALIAAVEWHAARLAAVADGLARRFKARFGGFDFTLAPFPSPQHSFGRAMESLGVSSIGRHGSLAAAAFLADTLDRARYPRIGFNGLMLPVLEDAVLAQRAAESLLSVKDLLAYAAVCGTGLDTIPLPGDTGAAELEAVLLDVAALSRRLRKPLLARLLPVTGKKAGDPTGFNFAYFANSRVLALDSQPLSGLLAGDETIVLQPRPRRS